MTRAIGPLSLRRSKRTAGTGTWNPSLILSLFRCTSASNTTLMMRAFMRPSYHDFQPECRVPPGFQVCRRTTRIQSRSEPREGPSSQCTRTFVLVTGFAGVLGVFLTNVLLGAIYGSRYIIVVENRRNARENRIKNISVVWTVLSVVLYYWSGIEVIMARARSAVI
jgi:hypothetical protein